MSRTYGSTPVMMYCATSTRSIGLISAVRPIRLPPCSRTFLAPSNAQSRCSGSGADGKPLGLGLEDVIIVVLNIREVLLGVGHAAAEALVVPRLHDVVEEERHALRLVVVGERRDAHVRPAPRVDVIGIQDGLA